MKIHFKVPFALSVNGLHNAFMSLESFDVRLKAKWAGETLPLQDYVAIVREDKPDGPVVTRLAYEPRLGGIQINMRPAKRKRPLCSRVQLDIHHDFKLTEQGMDRLKELAAMGVYIRVSHPDPVEGRRLNAIIKAHSVK